MANNILFSAEGAIHPLSLNNAQHPTFPQSQTYPAMWMMTWLGDYGIRDVPCREFPRERIEIMKQAVGLQIMKMAYEPRAIALGWYETGRWPEENGLEIQVQ